MTGTTPKRDTYSAPIIAGRLDSIVREMSWVLKRTSFTPILWNGQDFSCAVTDGRGRLLTLATKVPHHIMPMVAEVENLLRKFGDDISDGDIFLQNDPYLGGTHLPDVNVILPIFIEGELRFFTCARAHWGDVGGMTPGSISGTVKEIHQEGLRFPLVRAGRNHEIDPLLREVIAANTRVSAERLGDLDAQLTACRAGERRIRAIADRYGLHAFLGHIEEILDATEKRYQASLDRMPAGEYAFEDYLDNDGVDPEPVRLRATVSFGGPRVRVDFTGSSPAASGPVNCSGPAISTAAFVALKAVLDPTGPLNDGFLRLVQVNAPLGTVVNAPAPAPTGGSTEAIYAMTNVVSAALAQARPDLVAAADTKSANHHFITVGEGASQHIYYDYPPGGCGATAACDGPTFTKSMASGVLFMQALEIIEADGGLKFRRHALRDGSGGAGRFSGGLGIVREIEILAPTARMSIIGDGTRIPAFGLAGGRPGATSRWTLQRDGVGENLSEYGGKLSDRPLRQGDLVIVETAGGGGYGDPYLRDRAVLAREVADGYVDAEAAARTYDSVGEDLPALVISESSVPDPARGLRRLWVSPSTDLPEGALVELLAEDSPGPLRAQVVHTADVADGTGAIGRDGFVVLRMAVGDRVLVRVLDENWLALLPAEASVT